MGIQETQKMIVARAELAVIKVRRDATGITVYVKSRKIEEFFKGIHTGTMISGITGSWSDGHRGYRIPEIQFSRDGMTSGRTPVLSYWEQPAAIDTSHGWTNFSFLRTEGLSEGKTFKFSGLFIGREIERFREDFKVFVVGLYTDYMKTLDFEISITSNS